MWERIQEEFTWSRFGFKYQQPLEFALWSVRILINSFVIFHLSVVSICFQWSRNNKPDASSSRVCGYYVSYRCLAAALFIAILVANGCTTTQLASYWFIYLTQLGFIIQTLHLMIAAAVPIQLLLRSQLKDPSQINSI